MCKMRCLSTIQLCFKGKTHSQLYLKLIPVGVFRSHRYAAPPLSLMTVSGAFRSHRHAAFPRSLMTVSRLGFLHVLSTDLAVPTSLTSFSIIQEP
jgi:hypothetical protein